MAGRMMFMTHMVRMITFWDLGFGFFLDSGLRFSALHFGEGRHILLEISLSGAQMKMGISWSLGWVHERGNDDRLTRKR